MSMRLEKAMILAIATHLGEKDKIGEPYILHPIRVMQTFTVENLRIIAILHDVMGTNHAITAEAIEESEFGSPFIADALVALTRRNMEEYMDYINRVADNPMAKRVKIADLFDNLDPIRTNQLEHQTYMRLTRKYRRALSVLL